MRNSSRQRLTKMHQMLDKQLQDENEIQIQSRPPQQRRKQRSAFQHLRYTSNLKINNQENEYQIKQSQRPHVSSLLKKSLQKNQKYKRQLSQSKKSFAGLSSSDQENQKESNLNKNNMRGSRHSQINELQKKLMNLEKKMQNIGISSSQQDEQQQIQHKFTSKAKQTYKQRQKQNQIKKPLNSLMLRQNQIQYKSSLQDNGSKQVNNDSTSRFCNNQQQIINKNEQKINLPLSHRKNYQQQSQQDDSNSDDLQFKYEKYAKINKISKQKVKKVKQQQQNQQILEQINNNKKKINVNVNFENKSITNKLEKLSIIGKSQKQSAKIELNKQKKDFIYKQKQDKYSQKIQENKLSTLNSNPDRKLTSQHDLLQPRFMIQNKKSQSKSKKSTSKAISHKNLLIDKNKSLSKKKIALEKQQKLNIKNSHISNKPNKILDNSFRSENSAKSRKSANSLRSNGSKKSLSGYEAENPPNNNIIIQKKLAKKIENLEKDLQHYKRLAKRYQNQICQYKLLQIQYKKLQTQFKKSQQIRYEQKRIIQNFRNRTINM